ncbi:MAG: biopolymer transporter ExbD [Bacteriovoracaceae bacterium]|nr:biopolymer transporter ExbD [Bacteriovoracaceae bacterium]
MIRVPTARRRRKPEQKLNLTPIMDAVFIFIFFLLMSANFIKIMEIGSDVPIVSENDPPPQDKNPLALQLIIKENEIELMRGTTPQLVAKFQRLGDGKYDLANLHAKLVEFKKTKSSEESIIFSPEWEIGYEELIRVMDTVRLLEKTDDAIFRKTKEGLDEKIPTLFSKIVFSNLMS